VWLRGQNVGATPAVVPGLLPGRADLQVECAAGQAGRVHRVNFRAGRNLVTIDTRFEQAVQTSGRLRLAYASPRELAAHRVDDALTIGRAVGVAELLLVSLDDERAAAVVERIDVARGVVRGRASIGLRGGALEARELAAARQALAAESPAAIGGAALAEDVASSSRDAALAAPVVAAPRSGEGGAVGGAVSAVTPSAEARDDDGTPRGARLVAGVALGVIGAGGLAGGWVFYGVSRADLARLRAAFAGDPDFDARASAFDDATLLTYALGVPGGVLLTAAVPLLLPASEGVPWWSWSLGALGVAGVAVGGWALAQEGTADGVNADGSIRLRRTASLGVMLGLSALPLLAVPLTHGIRALGAGETAQAEVSIAAGGAVFRVGGTW
jgi:hypothetical protein